MKKTMFSKMLVCGCTFAMILGYLPGMNTVEAARPKKREIVKKISELPVDEDGDISFIASVNDVIVIELDEDRSIEGGLLVPADLIIRGDATFTASSIEADGDVTIESGSNIVVNSKGTKYDCFVCDGTINSAGNIKVNSDGVGIRAYDYYNDDDSTGNDNTTVYGINITGGTVDINCYRDGIVASGKINISGGDIKTTTQEDSAIYSFFDDIVVSGGSVVATAKNDAVVAGSALSITGGYFESVCTFDGVSDPKSNVVAPKKIEIADGITITSPEVSMIDNAYDYDNRYQIIAGDSSVPSRIVICEKAPEEEEEDKKEEDKKEEDKKDSQDEKKSDSDKDKTQNDTSKQEKKQDSSSDKKEEKGSEAKYTNEWVDGKWYNADGTQTYEGTLEWKQNETGWWVEDSTGWYPKSQWQKINGKYYYFCADGYMDYSEYREGCWLGADGAWDEAYTGGHWIQDSSGWWYEDASGWYPQNQWLWIDGVNYFFGANGYMQ